MTYLQIVLNIPLNQTFTYSYIPQENEKAELKPEIGKRAEIRFGNRKAVGFIVAVSETIPENCPVGAEKIRPVTKIIDTEPLFTEEIFELAQWISKYYLCSIGEAVFSIIPSRGKRESSAAGFSFMDFVYELTPVVAVILFVVLLMLALVFKKDLVTTEEKMKKVVDNVKSM